MLKNLPRFILIFVFLPLCTFNSYSQSSTDLIRDFLELENANEKRFTSLMNVDWHKVPLSRDSLNVLLNQGITLSKTMNKDYEMYKLLLIHTELIGDFSDERMKKLDDLIVFSKTAGWDSLQVTGLYWKGRGHGMRNEYTKATYILTELVNRKDKLIEKYYKVHAMAYEELAILKTGYGDPEGTLDMYKLSLEINEKNLDSTGMCSNLNNMGLMLIYSMTLNSSEYTPIEVLQLQNK